MLPFGARTSGGHQQLTCWEKLLECNAKYKNPSTSMDLTYKEGFVWKGSLANLPPLCFFSSVPSTPSSALCCSARDSGCSPKTVKILITSALLYTFLCISRHLVVLCVLSPVCVNEFKFLLQASPLQHLRLHLLP